MKRAGIILKNSKHQLLLVRGKLSHKWGFPKGSIIKNETYIQCAHRELYEETGVLLSDEKQETTFSAGTCIYFVYHTTRNDIHIQIHDKSEIMNAKWVHCNQINRLKNINNGLKSYYNTVLINDYDIDRPYIKKNIPDKNGWITV